MSLFSIYLPLRASSVLSALDQCNTTAFNTVYLCDGPLGKIDAASVVHNILFSLISLSLSHLKGIYIYMHTLYYGGAQVGNMLRMGSLPRQCQD